MAARRVLIIMLVLLGISSVLAITLPNPSRDDSDAPDTAATGASGATGGDGPNRENSEGEPTTSGPDGVVNETVRVEDKTPEAIKLKPGTRLVLSVESKKGSGIEIEGLGRVGFADRFAPAVFDLILPPTPGTFRVIATDVETEGEPVAVIETGS